MEDARIIAPNGKGHPGRPRKAAVSTLETNDAFIASSPTPETDIFSDLENLRLPQDFAETIGVKKALLTIPVRKPAKEWWIRIRPEFRLQTCVIELKEDRELYLVSRPLWSALSMEATFSTRLLLGTITRQNVFFIWALRLPASDGRTNEWTKSALEAANIAETRWIRVTSNMAAGSYDVWQATADIQEPEWPELPFNDLLRIAFKNRVIDSLDDPLLQRLQGRV